MRIPTSLFFTGWLVLAAAASSLRAAAPGASGAFGGRPNLAVAGVAEASSSQGGQDPALALDGDSATRWCADGASRPQWWQVDLGKEQKVTGVVLDWERRAVAYQYRVEGSADGKAWKSLVEGAKNQEAGLRAHDFAATTRFVRVTGLGGGNGGWISLWEVAVLGEKGAPQPAPAVAPKVAAGGGAAGKPGKPGKAAGNKDPLPPAEVVEKMKPVTEEKVAGILKEVKAPAEFDVTVFATPPAVNYPVFVAAAPDGTLYIASDGNGSLGRDPQRGRILRVRDTDGDGRADEVRVFVKDVDSPRGLVWDHDRLYVLHPPHISVFIDKDGDGRADEQKILVKNCAFTFKDRPADHTSNGLEIGVDGWLYAAIGDFGFMEAEGTDGRKLPMRGGGIIRVRADGTGLQLFAYGTRNILEAAVGPLLDLFTRDNTNDGGGWDVRFHHFTGLTDHGYPRLYKNFQDEHLAPLADFGGGSGTGAAWIDEPGIPEKWNNAPFTCDWGRNWVYQHRPTPKGATFSVDQKEFLGVPRITDLDVDASSRIYALSWKGATFNWAGMDVGYVVRVTPKGFTPAPLPDFATASGTELVKLLEANSHRRRLEAQRTLVRRGLVGETAGALETLAGDQAKPLASRVAAVFALKQGRGERAHEFLAKAAGDASITAWALRALTDHEGQLASVPGALLVGGLKSSDPRTRAEAVVGIARLGKIEHAAALVPVLADTDAVIAHTAMMALRELKAVEVCLAAIDRTDSPTIREGAFRVLYAFREPKLVDALLARLAKETEFARRQGLLTALCRLHFIEGVWKGNSWGTRPDTRGPLYQPEEWSETRKIADALNQVMSQAEAKEVAYLAGEFNRHRIESAGALEKLLALVTKDASVLPVAVGQLARVSAVPAAALPLLTKAAAADDTVGEVRANAIQALSRADLNAEAVRAALGGLVKLKAGKGDGAVFEQTTEAFFNSTKVEKEHAVLLAEAGKVAGAESLWADAALLRIVDRLKAKNKARDQITAALDAGWAEPKRRGQLIEASSLSGKKVLAEKILLAVADPDKAVATAAKKAVDKLKLQPAGAATGPLVGTLKVEEVLNAIMNTTGSVKRGEEVFTQVGCLNCHTVKPEQPLKGPFLGTISAIFKRRDLAENILLPNKSLAQGFVTQRFVLKDETEIDGFVTLEAADKVTVRNAAAQELVINVKDIVKREKRDISLMPEGLVNTLSVADFAALLDYLEGLAKK